tara:strand:- start:339 stop:674 length:336 start_codon:yes stop_codon:yes gene_type:complete
MTNLLTDPLDAISEDDYDYNKQVNLFLDHWVKNLTKYDLHYIQTAYNVFKQMKEVIGDDDDGLLRTTLQQRIPLHFDVAHFDFGVSSPIKGKTLDNAVDYAFDRIDWSIFE